MIDKLPIEIFSRILALGTHRDVAAVGLVSQTCLKGVRDEEDLIFSTLLSRDFAQERRLLEPRRAAAEPATSKELYKYLRIGVSALQASANNRTRQITQLRHISAIVGLEPEIFFARHYSIPDERPKSGRRDLYKRSMVTLGQGDLWT